MGATEQAAKFGEPEQYQEWCRVQYQMAHHELDLTVFAEHYSIIALLDRDTRSDPVRTRFQQNCETLGIPFHRLKRYSIENYFTVEALSRALKGQMPAIQGIDSDRSLDEQLGFSVKKNNRRIAQEMELADIAGTDFRQFLDRVEELCRRRAQTS